MKSGEGVYFFTLSVASTKESIMKRVYFAFFYLILVLSLSYGIEFRKDWKDAIKEAKNLHRRVFFVFHTDWCPHCRHLLGTTLKDPKVLEYFEKEGYILISVNPEKDRVAEKRFRVYGYPTMIVFDKNGKEIDRILGYMDSSELIKTIEDFKKGIGTLDYMLKEYAKDGENLDLIFEIATKYIARAEFQKAIDMLNIVLQKAEKKKSREDIIKALMRKAYAYYKWKRFSKAADCMLEIAKRYPGSKEAGDAYLDASYYAKRGGDIKRERELIKIFIEKFPNDPRSEKLKEKLKKQLETVDK